jgi:ComF family protein
MKYILNIFEKLLDFILPKEESVISIEKMSEEEIINILENASEIKNPLYTAIFHYKNKLTRKVIWEIKYRGNNKILQTFSKILYGYILDSIYDRVIFENFDKPLLIPIPISRKSLRERGFNQTERIVREIINLDKKENFEYIPNSLIKTKETISQSKIKNRTERLKNLYGCFSADNNIVAGRNIILIDDVITTGRTLDEAVKTLKNAGAKKIIGFAIAH